MNSSTSNNAITLEKHCLNCNLDFNNTKAVESLKFSFKHLISSATHEGTINDQSEDYYLTIGLIDAISYIYGISYDHLVSA